MSAAPSNANTSGLVNVGHIVWWKAGGVSYYPEGEAFGVSKSCRVEPLVTAASAQARIADLEARVEYLRGSRDGHAAHAHSEFEARVAAEARADRLAKALVMLGGEKPEQKRSYPNSYRGGFDAATDLAASIARAALQQETQP
ncbi:hypothetical protein A4249_06980 [Brevundimonas sp. GW460-12-10-14-LB2]|uniref:hypothetical protein n=1 Tax=Brevundimonas sp. GW460-12-10-14-LB2 TaxID=1827469 RepID=UPI0007BCB468|nr:hypothetical protein [Brevundimonas sp. GW460-12-10-14-LB2]ANC53422.1 hypothetical protein A4249_06980 [Brevundimonas sp. GW460-12-10-14-LB2]